MFKKLVLVVVSLASFLILISCGGGSGNNQTIATIDIVGATSLFISSGSISTSEVGINEGTNTTIKLFKITTSGYVEEVTYKDKDGNPVTVTNQPLGIYNVNSSYVIVTFGTNELAPEASYLVRKSDGAVYEIDSYNSNCAQTMAPFTMSSSFKNGSPVASDSNNNIYFYSHRSVNDCSAPADNYTVYKITNPSTTPSINDYISDTDNLRTFAIDTSGNLLYSGSLVSNSQSSVSRIKKLNGGLDNVSPHNYGYWKAVDGNMYYLAYNTPNYQIKKVTVDSGFNVIETNYGASFNNTDLEFTTSTSYLLNFSDKTIIVTTGQTDLKTIEVYNASNTPTKIDLSSTFNSITTVTSSDSYYYISGTDTTNKNILKKCAISNHVCSNLLTAGQYDVYKMIASNNGEVTFNALRMSDGAKVIAKVDDSGTVTILNTTLNTQVTILERVL